MKAATKPPTGDQIAEALVLLDVLLQLGDTYPPNGIIALDDHRGELVEMLALMRRGALAEYLRRFPRARAKGSTVTVCNEGGDWDVACVFCRADLATYGDGRKLGEPVWRRINLHTDRCAAKMIVGHLMPVPPGGAKGEKLTPVAKLVGKMLVREATEAAEYLGRPDPKARYSKLSRAGIAGGRATELRKLVSEARRAAETAARGAL